MMRIISEDFAGAGSCLVISTKAEGRAEKSGRGWTTRQIRGQISRLRFASLEMTDPHLDHLSGLRAGCHGYACVDMRDLIAKPCLRKRKQSVSMAPRP